MSVFHEGVFDSVVYDSTAQSDQTVPVVTVTEPVVTRISRVSGKDTSAFSFSVDEDYQAYEIRVVPAANSPVTAGTLLESGTGGTANTARNVDVTDDELVAALGAEGVNIVKVFAQDLAGNWSL